MFPFQLHSTFCLYLHKVLGPSFKKPYISLGGIIFFQSLFSHSFPFIAEGLFWSEKILNKEGALRVQLELIIMILLFPSTMGELPIHRLVRRIYDATKGTKHKCPEWNALEKGISLPLALLSGSED